MSDIINLRQARKHKARHAKEVVAEANRVKHGIPKSAHHKHKMLAMKLAKQVDSHKLED